MSDTKTDVVRCQARPHYCPVDESLPAVTGGRLCASCESEFKRTKPREAPMTASLRAYVKAVETGEVNPFKSFSVKYVDGFECLTPLRLSPSGKLPTVKRIPNKYPEYMHPGMRAYLKRVESGAESPFTRCVIRIGKTTFDQPVKLTLSGKLPKAA